ncbi:MAG: prevent-host-death protein [Deltaproteobacteria bacterium]|nr:prevent-host-death protein [Deltaproteobacteria bacterium]
MDPVIEINDNEVKLNECVDQIERTGKALAVFRGKKLVAKLIPHKAIDPLIMDPMLKGAFFVDDAVAPLSEADWPEALR